MAKTFDFNAIKGIKLVDKSGKVKDEAVKSKLGDQNLFRFKDGIVWAKPFKLNFPTPPHASRVEISRTSTKRSLVEKGLIKSKDAYSQSSQEDIYYGDTLEIKGVSTSDAYTDPIVSLSQTTVTGDVDAIFIAGEHKSYDLKMPALPTGVESCTVERYLFGGGVPETFNATSSEKVEKIYHSDKLIASRTLKRGYSGNPPSLDDGRIAPTDVIYSVDRSVNLIIPTPSLWYAWINLSVLPAGVDAIRLYRDSSPIANAKKGKILEITKDNTSYVSDKYYLDDVFSFEWDTTEGYYDPTFNHGNPFEITAIGNNISLRATSGGVKQFTLTIPSLPTGVKSLTVTRTSSPLANASKGELSNDATIYYGDSLVVSAVATDGYTNPSVNISSVSVKSDVSISVTAGEIKKHTVTFDLNGGEESNVPTSMVVEHGAIINMEAYLPPYRVDEDNYSYEFQYWEANGVDGSEFRITEDTHIVARYYRQAYPTWHYMKLSNTSWDITPSPTGPYYTTVSGEIYKTNSKIMAVPTRFHTGTDGHMIMTGAEGDSARFTMNKAGIVLDSGSSKYSSSGTGYYGNGFGYSLTASKGKINFYVWADRIQDDDKWYGNEAGQIFYLTSGHITLNAIEQFYSDPSENAIV